LGRGYTYFLVLDKAQHLSADFSTVGTSVAEIDHPHAEFTVKCLSAKPADQSTAIVIDAKMMSEQLRTKYDISPNDH
jgi:hypothetical protein